MSVGVSPGRATVLWSTLPTSRWYAIAPTLTPATRTTHRPMATNRTTAPSGPGVRSRPWRASGDRRRVATCHLLLYVHRLARPRDMPRNGGMRFRPPRLPSTGHTENDLNDRVSPGQGSVLNDSLGKR